MEVGETVFSTRLIFRFSRKRAFSNKDQCRAEEKQLAHLVPNVDEPLNIRLRLFKGCELSLLQQDHRLLACLLPFTKFKLNMTLDNVS
jgi:hypothetical protein